MVLDRHISTEGHHVRLAVEATREGWNLREELDRTTVSLKHYDDWHRVDRAIQMLELQLRHRGLAALTPH